jgi:hypothetical protein
MEVYAGPDYRPVPFALETHVEEIALVPGGIKNVRPTIVVEAAECWYPGQAVAGTGSRIPFTLQPAIAARENCWLNPGNGCNGWGFNRCLRFAASPFKTEPNSDARK